MKYLSTAFIFFGLVTIFFVMPTAAFAEVPDIKVRVVNAITGAPINGVWVRQANHPDQGFRTCQINPPLQSYRYEQTDLNGNTIFSGKFWQDDYVDKWKFNSPIDTNLDDINDAVYINYVSGVDSITGEVCTYEADFGCGQNPHKFSVVMPAGWKGSFSESQDISFNNLGGEFGVTLYYYPEDSQAQTPPPQSSWCDQNCSEKSVGTLNRSNLKFTPVTTLNDGNSYFIRLKLNNQSPGENSFVSRNLGAVKVEEEIVYNALYLYSPVADSSLIISRVKAGQDTEQNITSSLCPNGPGGPTCVSNLKWDTAKTVLIGYSVTLPSVDSNDTYYAYYRIIVRNPVVNEYRNTFLDSSVNSVIRYLDQNEVRNLDNLRVQIEPNTTTSPLPVGNSTSKKEIGSIPSLGSFIPETTINQNQDYWVKISIGNNSDGQYSEAELHEVINSQYFSFLPLVYTGSKDTSTFFIEDYLINGSSKTIRDNTNSICNNLSCVSSSGSKLTVKPTAGLEGEYNSFFIYFKVRAIQNSSGNLVKVDIDDQYPAHTGSYIDFTNRPNSQLNEPGLDNEEVVICPVGGCATTSAAGYFQVLGGNAYSKYSGSNPSISVALPPSTKFIPEYDLPRKTGALIHRDEDYGYFGSGDTTDSQWYLRGYTDTSTIPSYADNFARYSNRPIIEKNISGVNQLDSGVGYYIDQGSVTSGRYTISGGGWKNQTINNQQAVIFVPGDLYINENLNVTPNGNSSIIFVVKGNVGIDPAVTNVEGIFFVDGTIDTACNSATGFSGSFCNSGSADLSQQLTLEGTYYTNQGFILNRNTVGSPGEVFQSRPDFILSAAPSFGRDVYSWKEVID